MARPGARTTSARVLSSIINGLEVFSSLVLAVMMLLTFVDVVGRYVLGKPIFGASEMISTLLSLLIFAGLVLPSQLYQAALALYRPAPLPRDVRSRDL
jgi:TRAP-type C4-dicarboxylate transport system permease small subunit